MGPLPDGPRALRAEDAVIETPEPQRPTTGRRTRRQGGMEMSASTRTIQQPIGKGSIFGNLAMAAAVILAAVSITWGATNLVATKAVTPPVPAPIFLDKGSRTELVAPLVLRAPASVLHRARTSTSTGPGRQMRAE